MKTGDASATGKFNGGQKANLAATLLLTAGLTGSLIWVRAALSVDLVELGFLIHDLLAISAVLLFAGHVLFALYYSESLYGIISEEVDEKWAEERYPGWIKKRDKDQTD